MTKVSSSKLKAKLGQYMRAIRAGREIVVTDRDVPVARLVPFTAPADEGRAAVYQPRDPAAPPLCKVKIKGLAYRGTDVTQLLREDRDRR